jgi:hypothetical protein
MAWPGARGGRFLFTQGRVGGRSKGVADFYSYRGGLEAQRKGEGSWGGGGEEGIRIFLSMLYFTYSMFNICMSKLRKSLHPATDKLKAPL